jgi:hypothetical protein
MLYTRTVENICMIEDIWRRLTCLGSQQLVMDVMLYLNGLCQLQ